MDQSDLSNGDEEEEEKEGCSSCESGWTKYFSSSVHVGYGNETECADKDSADDEDGDSLASDASTGKLLRDYSNDDDEEDEDETIAEEEHRRNLKVVKKTEYEKVGREDAAASDDKLEKSTNFK